MTEIFNKMNSNNNCYIVRKNQQNFDSNNYILSEELRGNHCFADKFNFRKTETAETNIIDYVIQKLNFRIQLISNSKSIITNIYSLDEFVYNKSDILDNYCQIQDDIHQGIEALKTLIRINKELSEELNLIKNDILIYENRCNSFVKKIDYLENLNYKNESSINRLAQEISEKNVLLMEYEGIIKSLNNKVNFNVNNKFQYNSNENNNNQIQLNNENRNERINIQSSLNNLNDKGRLNENISINNNFKNIRDKESDNRKNTGNDSNKISRKNGKNKNERQFDNENNEVKNEIETDIYSFKNKEKNDNNYDYLFKQVSEIVNSNEDVRNTLIEIYGKNFLNDLFQFNYDIKKLSDIFITIERVLKIINANNSSRDSNFIVKSNNSLNNSVSINKSQSKSKAKLNETNNNKEQRLMTNNSNLSNLLTETSKKTSKPLSIKLLSPISDHDCNNPNNKKSKNNSKNKIKNRSNEKQTITPVFKGGIEFEKCLREYEVESNRDLNNEDENNFNMYSMTETNVKNMKVSTRLKAKSLKKKFKNFGSNYGKNFSDISESNATKNSKFMNYNNNSNSHTNNNNLVSSSISVPVYDMIIPTRMSNNVSLIDNNKNIKIEDETDYENDNNNYGNDERDI